MHRQDILPLLEQIEHRILGSTLKKLAKGEKCIVKTAVLLKAMELPEIGSESSELFAGLWYNRKR